MFKVTVDVFGTYNRGKLVGQTNPKQVVSLTMFGDSVKAALGKINKATNGAIFNVVKVDDLRPAWTRRLDSPVAVMQALARAA